jgi:murein endopeptidase
MKKGMPMRATMLVQRNAKSVTDKYYEPGEKDAIMKAATAQKSKLGL